MGQIFVDDQTGEPSWVTVSTGLFGNKVSFVPLENAQQRGEDLVVGFDAQQVKDAPHFRDDEHLTPEQEDELFAHYGMSTGYQDADADPRRSDAGLRDDRLDHDQDRPLSNRDADGYADPDAERDAGQRSSDVGNGLLAGTAQAAQRRDNDRDDRYDRDDRDDSRRPFDRAHDEDRSDDRDQFQDDSRLRAAAQHAETGGTQPSHPGDYDDTRVNRNDDVVDRERTDAGLDPGVATAGTGSGAARSSTTTSSSTIGTQEGTTGDPSAAAASDSMNRGGRRPVLRRYTVVEEQTITVPVEREVVEVVYDDDPDAPRR